ncbi:acyltransferase family protein [Aeromonas hydrophila]|uniref:acyltransferase family protein n=1 Tax=Aeromonas hydrophila TaxID=644 RepID=UPI0029DD23D4|nr:acyltransferase family protein [Aeromonas hydrophila]MDX7778993.1 acyltransferase family protein [Aeromonas hydrophila]
MFTPSVPVQPKAFRQDINGLRAWAVIAVVLYHFGVPGFAGGFVGVDVFFVISGFLMTRIIISGVERGQFSLWEFYLARARRIIPALLVLCTALLIIGWFWLPSADYNMLATHTAAATTFLSNMQFWREAGYFDAASHEKWLLHTWSLSVEWQFYILLPLGVILAWRLFGKRGVKIALAIIGMSSFALSIYTTQRWPSAAFYLLPTRAWEMLAGGLIWWAIRSRTIPVQPAKVMEAVGMLMIVSAIAFFDASMGWPGFYALLPTAGAMLILAAGRQNSLFTSNFIARHLGASSYSIYLWHWPLVVILNYLGETNNITLIILGILLSVIAGECSFRFVENPSRITLGKLSRYKEPILIGVPAMLVLITSYGVIATKGANYVWRQGASSLSSEYMDKYSRDNYLTPSTRAEYRLECDFFDDEKYIAKHGEIAVSCTQKQEGMRGIFLWGDSHAQALSYGLRQHLKQDTSLYQVATSACQPHLGGDSATKGEFKLACDRSNEFALHEIARLKPEVVIMVQKGDHDKNNFSNIIAHLNSIGIKHIVILGPVPQWQPSLPRTIALRHFSTHEVRFNDSSFDQSLFTSDRRMKEMISGYNSTNYISLLDHLCEDGKCLAKVDDKNTPLVWDYGHLSMSGADFVVKEILLKDPTLGMYLQ